MGVPISRDAKSVMIRGTTVYKYLKSIQAPSVRTQ